VCVCVCVCVWHRVSGEAIPGWDCGDEAAAWFSQYLKEDHRLLYNPGIQLRAIDTKMHLYVNSAKNDDKVITLQRTGPQERTRHRASTSTR